MAPCCDAVLVSAEFDTWRHTRSAGDNLVSWTGTATSRSSCRSHARRMSLRSPRGTAGEAGQSWSRNDQPTERRRLRCRQRPRAASLAAAAGSLLVDVRSSQTDPEHLLVQSVWLSPAQTTRWLSTLQQIILDTKTYWSELNVHKYNANIISQYWDINHWRVNSNK